MTALAPHLSCYLREHLPNERRASQHTCEAYAQGFQLLLCFAASRLKIKPAKIEIERLDAALILAFLEHLEKKRGNSPRTRNARLAAINSFFRYLEYRVPSCLDQSRRIHAIPMKKTDQPLVAYLTRDELQALLDAPNADKVTGIRDRAMLHLAFAAGMRVSELVGIRLDQIDRQTMASVHIMGKGRRERVLPLWKQTAATLKAWLKVRPSSSAPELFLNARAQAMTRSGFEYILAKHVVTAARKVPSIGTKGVSPHVLRHSCAMHTLQATRDVRKVSLWLGHASLQTTEVYLRADPSEKLEALAAMAPPMLKPGPPISSWPCWPLPDVSSIMRTETDEKSAAGRNPPSRTLHNCVLHITAHIGVTRRRFLDHLDGRKCQRRSDAGLWSSVADQPFGPGLPAPREQLAGVDAALPSHLRN